MTYNDEHRTRMQDNLAEIGFHEAETWQDSEAHYDGDTLQIQGHPVMENWEEPYMRELARIACSRGGIVLEVGFGMAISAEFIQQHAISEHWVIEANKDVYQRLQSFAKKAPHPVRPLYGFWQDVIDKIEDESVDGILFDPYPLSETEINHYQIPFFRHAHRILRPGGVFTYYSDEVQELAPEQTNALNLAGFEDIDHTICAVNPPADCLYWQHSSILAPIVTKR